MDRLKYAEQQLKIVKTMVETIVGRNKSGVQNVQCYVHVSKETKRTLYIIQWCACVMIASMLYNIISSLNN